MGQNARTTRTTVNLQTELIEKLKAQADAQGKTTTAALNEAMWMKLFIDGELSNGSKLLIERTDGKLRELVFSTRL